MVKPPIQIFDILMVFDFFKGHFLRNDQKWLQTMEFSKNAKTFKKQNNRKKEKNFSIFKVSKKKKQDQKNTKTVLSDPAGINE